MSIVLWLAKLQWSIIVDHLTYERFWSIDRVSNLLIGVTNMVFISLSLVHHLNWLIPLCFLNVSILVSSMLGNSILNSILTNLGFKEREEILQHLKIQVRAKEQIKKKMNECNIDSSTNNTANVFVFDSLESQTINHKDESYLVFLYQPEENALT